MALTWDSAAERNTPARVRHVAGASYTGLSSYLIPNGGIDQWD